MKIDQTTADEPKHFVDVVKQIIDGLRRRFQV